MWALPLFCTVLSCAISLGRPELIDDVQHKQQTQETSFATNVRVEASISCPRLPEVDLLALYVNDTVRKDMHALYDAYIKEMRVSQESIERGEEFEEFNERSWHYKLEPVCRHSNLIGLYGVESRYTGGCHGSVHYVTRTFWKNGDIICELSLDDLFLPGFREQLFRYCEHYFKSHQWGYYSYDDDFWIGFSPEHLDAFLITKQGLLLIFQNYVVSGFDDYPSTLLVPYSHLKHFARPEGPLHDHWLTTKAPQMATDGVESQSTEIP